MEHIKVDSEKTLTTLKSTIPMQSTRSHRQHPPDCLISRSSNRCKRDSFNERTIITSESACKCMHLLTNYTKQHNEKSHHCHYSVVEVEADTDATSLQKFRHYHKNKCECNANASAGHLGVVVQGIGKEFVTVAKGVLSDYFLKTTTTTATASTTAAKNKRRRAPNLKPTHHTVAGSRAKVGVGTRNHGSKTKFRWLPSLGATSFVTLLTLVCLETVLLSTVSNCAKTFYMHWNTSNSIFRIDNTDHIIDVNKGNLAFEFDQVHIICPVYEPGTMENETEKYIIYNVSKVEYETCRITNADPRVIAICDKPQKLMFFTITFRPFTPQPGGLEFLPGNDYYFISTSSKDDLYRRIGGRCSTNNMKVVFKVCCAPEEKNKTQLISSTSSAGGTGGETGRGGAINESIGNVASGDTLNSDINGPTNVNNQQHVNTIGINGVNTGLIPGGSGNIGGGSIQLNPLHIPQGGSGAINTNIDQFNRIPLQTNGNNVMGNNNLGLGGNGGVMLSPGHGGINMIPSNVGGGGGSMMSPYPGYAGPPTGIRINNVPSQQHHPSHKTSNSNNNNGKDSVGRNDGTGGGGHDGDLEIGFGGNSFLPPIINTNHSNIVQSTLNWPGWGDLSKLNTNNINNNNKKQANISFKIAEENTYFSPSHKPTATNNKIKNIHYDKHPNEVVKNEELTYSSGGSSASPALRSVYRYWNIKIKSIALHLERLLAGLVSKMRHQLYQQHQKYQLHSLSLESLSSITILLLSMFIAITTHCLFRFSSTCSTSHKFNEKLEKNVVVKSSYSNSSVKCINLYEPCNTSSVSVNSTR